MSGTVDASQALQPPAVASRPAGALTPPILIGEAARLADLYAAELMHPGCDEAYTAIARTAALVTGAPAALITLVAEQRQVCKACFGIEATDVDRRDAFCSYAILEPERTLHVPDATLDERFRDNPYVVGEPHVRFYCGVPIVSTAGRAFGTLCVIGYEPRELDLRQLQALRDLATQTSALIQARTRVRELEERTASDGEAHTALLRCVGELVDSAADLDELLEQSLTAIVRELHVDAGGLWWHDGENLAVDPLWVDPTGALTGIHRARAGLAFPPEVIIHSRETATRHGADVLPAVVLAAMQGVGISGSHTVPIVVDSEIVGAFELIPNPAGEPSPRCLQAATQVGAEVGRWIERDRTPRMLPDGVPTAPNGRRGGVSDPRQIRRRATVKARLERAVESGAIGVAYEPIVRVADDAVAGVEVLARWHDDELGDVTPGEFIPIAEESGAIRALGAQVRRRALVDLPHVVVAAPPGDAIALWKNIAAEELTNGFAAAVLADLRVAGVDPSRLTLELTERAALEPRDVASAQLEELRSCGVGIAIDDFGTGFTSLTQLRTLDLTHVKIDRSFITGLVGEQSARVKPIVSGIILLSHSLGLEVVAEGVETAAQMEVVRELGADLVQGHLLAPVPSPGPLRGSSRNRPRFVR